MKRVLAILNLGVHFFLHLLRKLVEFLTGKRKDPYKQFIEQFRADRLEPLPPEDHSTLIELQHCNLCNLCPVHILAARELRDLSQPIDPTLPFDNSKQFRCPFGVDTDRILTLYRKVVESAR